VLAYISDSVPDPLKDVVAQHTLAHELWVHFDRRFSDRSLTSTTSLWSRIMSLKLSDYSGVSDYMTALSALELELKRANKVVEESFLAGAIALAIGPTYPSVREILLMPAGGAANQGHIFCPIPRGGEERPD